MKLRFSLVGFLFAYVSVFAQELPPIENYPSSLYGASSQNWSVSQTSEGHLYFGNNSGLLEFNGAVWTLYPSPNGTIIRAVEVVDNRIYTGCYMELGYWKPNAHGGLEYVSLVEKLNLPFVEDEHFWSITSYDEWILFQSLSRIYLYNSETEEFRVIDFGVQRARIFNLGDEVVVPNTEGELYTIRDGRAVLWLDEKLLEGIGIAGVYKHADGRMIIGENGEFFKLGDELTKWDVDLELDGSVYVYNTLQLDDGSFVLGTVSNGFIQVSPEGKVVRQVDQESGLLNNTVLSLFQDRDENLWLGLDNGISNVNLGSAFRIYSDYKGKLGVVYASKVFGDNLYLGTNQGLFYKKMHKEEDFKLIDGTNGQVWSLDLIHGSLF